MTKLWKTPESVLLPVFLPRCFLKWEHLPAEAFLRCLLPWNMVPKLSSTNPMFDWRSQDQELIFQESMTLGGCQLHPQTPDTPWCCSEGLARAIKNSVDLSDTLCCRLSAVVTKELAQQKGLCGVLLSFNCLLGTVCSHLRREPQLGTA